MVFKLVLGDQLKVHRAMGAVPQVSPLRPGIESIPLCYSHPNPVTTRNLGTDGTFPGVFLFKTEYGGNINHPRRFSDLCPLISDPWQVAGCPIHRVLCDGWDNMH